MNIRKKLIIATISSALGATLLGVFSFAPLNRINGLEQSRWMSQLDDDTNTRTLSLPGTHNSGATHSIFDVSGKCQDVSISEQLKMGVRFLDIRLQSVEDKFKVVHSFVDQKLTFKEVLNTTTSFIKNNSSEFLIMSIKEEESAIDSTKDFEELLKEDFEFYKDVISFDRELPYSLEEARGKIYILSRYYGSTIGIEASSIWRDDGFTDSTNFFIQDNYNISDINEKISDIEITLKESKTNTSRLVLNYTSCYIDDAFPPINAGIPAITINRWLNNVLVSEEGSTGILIVDYASTELITNIYRRNF